MNALAVSILPADVWVLPRHFRETVSAADISFQEMVREQERTRTNERAVLVEQEYWENIRIKKAKIRRFYGLAAALISGIFFGSGYFFSTR